MSRTRQQNETEYGNSNFPIAAAVPNCYLKSIKYKKTKEKEVAYLSFKHNEEWITLWLENPKRSNFDSVDDWKRERIRISAIFENILYAYLQDGDLMKEVRRESSDFKTYYDNVVRYLEKVKYWNVPVELKTLPNKSGEPMITKFPPFMRLHGDLGVNLTYSAKEERMVIEWKRRL